MKQRKATKLVIRRRGDERQITAFYRAAHNRVAILNQISVPRDQMGAELDKPEVRAALGIKEKRS